MNPEQMQSLVVLLLAMLPGPGHQQLMQIQQLGAIGPAEGHGLIKGQVVEHPQQREGRMF